MILNLKTKKLIVIAGPTAIGKTKLAISIAKMYKTDIISADSRQMFKELSIGVDKPSKKQLTQINHHFINYISITEDYSVGKYEKDCKNLLSKLFKKNNIQIMCGGSGLYLESICSGLNTFPEIKKETKQEISIWYQNKGLDFLKKKLKNLDTDTYNSIDLENPRRVIRALEVCMSGNCKFSELKQQKKFDRTFDILKICLTDQRQNIYKRIDNRVDKMIESGLLDEAKDMYKYRNLKSLQTIGYKEFFEYFEGKKSKIDAINEIKKNSRRYAKRQITWFKGHDYLQININNLNIINEQIQRFTLNH